MTITLFYRFYLITFGLLLGAIAGLVLYLDQVGAVSLCWAFNALADVAVAAGSVLAITGAFGKPETVERWADNELCHAEGTAYAVPLALRF